MADRPGSLYVLTNPAWGDWVKIGHVLGTGPGGGSCVRTLDKRLSNYNVSDPLKRFGYYVACYASCAISAETYAHAILAVNHKRGDGEWFRCPPGRAKRVVENACQIARLRPEVRARHLVKQIQEERDRVDNLRDVLKEIEDEKVSHDVDVPSTARAAHQIIDVLVEEWQKARDYTTTEADQKIEAAAAAIQRRLDALGGSA